MKWRCSSKSTCKAAVAIAGAGCLLVFVFSILSSRESVASDEKLFEALNQELIQRAKEYEEGLENDDILNDFDDNQEEKVFGELDPNEVRLDHEIFFFVSTGAIDLSPREACAVEAAAKYNPGKHVFVLFITPNITDILQSNTLSILLSFQNVVLRYIRVSKYFTSPTIKQWFIESGFHKLNDMDEYLNSALTYAVLHKFGGIVLNFDVLLRRPVTSLGQFVSRCSEDELATFPLSLNSQHPLLEDLLQQVGPHHDPEDFRSVGSRLVTQRVKQLCHVDFLDELVYRQCASSPPLRPVADFCPFEEAKHWMLFDRFRAKLVQKRLQETESYGVRLWGRASNGLASWGAANDSTAVYQLAKESCPFTLLVVKDHL